MEFWCTGNILTSLYTSAFKAIVRSPASVPTKKRKRLSIKIHGKTWHRCSVFTLVLFPKWAPSSKFVSSSIPSWQILTAHAQPFRGPGIWLSVWLFLLTHCLYERAAEVLARLPGCAGSPEPCCSHRRYVPNRLTWPKSWIQYFLICRLREHWFYVMSFIFHSVYNWYWYFVRNISRTQLWNLGIMNVNLNDSIATVQNWSDPVQ